MLFVLAAVLELFVDWAPPNASAAHCIPASETVCAHLKEKGWELAPFEKGEESTWVFWNLGAKVANVDWSAHPKEKTVLFMWEPPTVQEELYDPKVQAHFGKIFTWDDDLVDNCRFFKFHYPVLQQRIAKLPSFEEKKFCTMIARNMGSKHPKQLYKERKALVRFFEGKPAGDFDLYGMFWNPKKFKNYRGSVPDKLAVLKNYQFSICYENMRDIKGYISEKIFDCFAAGVVPVYWGASNVTDYIPENCFIDRRKFKDNEALYAHLKKMTREDYEAYLQNGDKFLKSDRAKLFSSEHFAETFLKVVD